MKEKFKAELKEAMKQKNRVKMDTIRGVLSAIQYEEMQKSTENLPVNDVVAILQREVKKREETIELSEKAGRTEVVESSKQEIAIIQIFLPTQLSASEIEKILVDMKTTEAGLNMGAAMKVLKEKYAGQYDGKVASEVAKRVLG